MLENKLATMVQSSAENAAGPQITTSGPFETDEQLLIENDDDEGRIMDTTIPPPVFARDEPLPKSSIYEVRKPSLVLIN